MTTTDQITHAVGLIQSGPRYAALGVLAELVRDCQDPVARATLQSALDELTAYIVQSMGGYRGHA
jgi:hypothetical protein